MAQQAYPMGSLLCPLQGREAALRTGEFRLLQLQTESGKEKTQSGWSVHPLMPAATGTLGSRGNFCPLRIQHFLPFFFQTPLSTKLIRFDTLQLLTCITF